MIDQIAGLSALWLLGLLTTTACALTHSQEFLADHATTQTQVSLPLINYNNWPMDWFNCVNITVGTPPQSFRAVVDIGWTDLLLPSAQCDSKACSSGFCRYVWNMYNSSASTTNEIDHSPFADLRTAHYTLSWLGAKNRDVVDIGGFRLAAQDFLNADYVNALGFLDFFDFDAVLGLPRYPADCDRGDPYEQPVCGPGPFHRMINEEMLDRNAYGLLLSNASAANFSRGSLDLGFVDSSKYEGDLVTFPVSELPRQVEKDMIPSAWHVDMHAFSIGPDTFPLPNYQAVFYTIDPFIYVPRYLYKELARRIAPDSELEGWLIVDCDTRNELPDLHFTLGPDRMDIALTPWQYIFSGSRPGFENETGPCVLPFLDIDFGPFEGDDINAIGLGNTFLKNFYSVFDVDNQTISCKYGHVDY